eukprot:CAMPEP_0202977816 /NCGR_PEP_ID=MMETSP1396-20130829/84473_1 /ASSEMBLY_ACC=CAM_ASM_000872 /TAXON_ID= /ORGANISM="Pseudokeronopsis sp., Strain Brazil" /LENGTH=164 /DNA_ID=CAMNT_0049716629 /DNA_START=670 /DNA_END=1164 /DNA_ORIENTATION=+
MGYKVDLYTWGQPRVGDYHFADFQNSFLTGKNLRGVYRNDPVPTLPYEGVLKFFHAGREIHFYEVDLYTWGQPRVGDSHFADFQNSFLAGKNLRGVYRNDPVPTLPYEGVLKFFHAGREIHFYECDHKSYVPYPFGKDDSPFTILGTWDDHSGYFCLFDDLLTT